jgi:hypothetical protein
MRNRAAAVTWSNHLRRRVFLLFLLSQSAACSEVQGSEISLDVSTSSPHVNTFVLGETAVLHATAEVENASAAAPELTVSVRDAQDGVIELKKIAMKSDGKHWTATWEATAAKLGFYRAYVAMDYMGRHIPMAASGSRPEGFVTYCIVPDPASRRKLSEADAFFGMQGGFSEDTTSLLPLLGIHWVLGNLNWTRYAPQNPDQFLTQDTTAGLGAGATRQGNQIEPMVSVYKGVEWPIYPLPSLEVAQPKWMATLDWEARYAAWAAYCKHAARYFSQLYPDLAERVYQTTWEPNYKFQFDGTLTQLVQWQRIAYEAVHSVDPHAVVIGPTGVGFAPKAMQWTSDLAGFGMWKYVDGWSIHPYTVAQLDSSTRLAALEEGLASIQGTLQSASGKSIAIYSTEAGYQAAATNDSELEQADYIVKSNVIMAELRLRLSMAFYIADFPKKSGYGFYYNCTTIPFGAPYLSPKPVAPAYAAMTYMLEGAHGVGTQTLAHGIRIYKFARDGDNILVIWGAHKSSDFVDIPGVNAKWKAFDWMGNPISAFNSSGQIKVTQFPEYVRIAGKA